MVRWAGEKPDSTMATGVVAGFPCATSSVAATSSPLTPMSRTRVPSSAASEAQSSPS